mmetsp:Transcript_13006/g.41544  ORF Transcript_13006/g.41544 Transcript_13006/m.41544 type:complete len:492 (-) Transcript_13006:147-1622(-)
MAWPLPARFRPVSARARIRPRLAGHAHSTARLDSARRDSTRRTAGRAGRVSSAHEDGRRLMLARLRAASRRSAGRLAAGGGGGGGRGGVRGRPRNAMATDAREAAAATAAEAPPATAGAGGSPRAAATAAKVDVVAALACGIGTASPALAGSGEPTVIAALYKFARLEDFEAMREPLLEFCREKNIRGTLLLAREGINGTVAGERAAIDALLARLRGDPRLADLEHKESHDVSQPFLRMKVRLKREIVTLGVDEVDPTETVGTYVDPKDWNALISDPDVLLIDTRNKYEVKIGTFRNAKDPQTDSFRDFPQYCDEALQGQDKDKKIAMFCTGGIRCEKSTSFLRQRGFNNVYHLKGGILKYLEEVPAENSLWDGECYVFDHRVSVKHNLERGSYEICGGCRHPLLPEEREGPKFRQGVHCLYCMDNLTPEHLQRVVARQLQIELAAKRQEQHLGTFDASPQAIKRQRADSRASASAGPALEATASPPPAAA